MPRAVNKFSHNDDSDPRCALFVAFFLVLQAKGQAFDGLA
jgi:hypothetical protein